MSRSSYMSPRLGELLLRPSTLTRFHRSISSTPSQAAQPARKDEEEPDFQQPPQPPQSQPQPQQQQQRRSPFGSINPFGPASQQQPSSGDELRAARSNHIFGSEFSNGFRRPRQTPKLNFDSMTPSDSMLNPSLSNKPSDAALLATQQEEAFANYPRLNPTYGRTVDLDHTRGRDLVRGISMLASLTARNRIKSDFAVQRFHERPGLKRKRLNSERWRKRFKAGFTAVTSRVSELTRKGW
ncbi:hypothetical protein NX059_011640 [Plenodomus lindquistii]|nr:hypothetical protein NX059_011640 [Plenodomus lindquistii]